jgi:hypothetical protein
MGLVIREWLFNSDLSIFRNTHTLKLCDTCSYVVVSFPGSEPCSTPTIKRSLSPGYTTDATFSFPICLDAVDSIKRGMLKCVVWDEDLVKDDYLGEVGLRVEEWFPGGQGGGNPKFAFDEAEVRHS